MSPSSASSRQLLPASVECYTTASQGNKMFTNVHFWLSWTVVKGQTCWSICSDHYLSCCTRTVQDWCSIVFQLRDLLKRKSTGRQIPQYVCAWVSVCACLWVSVYLCVSVCLCPSFLVNNDLPHLVSPSKNPNPLFCPSEVGLPQHHRAPTLI
jgi:hypothetical protein